MTLVKMLGPIKPLRTCRNPKCGTDKCWANTLECFKCGRESSKAEQHATWSVVCLGPGGELQAFACGPLSPAAGCQTVVAAETWALREAVTRARGPIQAASDCQAVVSSFHEDRATAAGHPLAHIWREIREDAPERVAGERPQGAGSPPVGGGHGDPRLIPGLARTCLGRRLGQGRRRQTRPRRR